MKKLVVGTVDVESLFLRHRLLDKERDPSATALFAELKV